MNVKSEEPLIEDFISFKLIFNLTQSLRCRNEAVWDDEYGTTLISMGENIAFSLLQNWGKDSINYAVVLSPIIEGQVAVPPNRRLASSFREDLDCVLSIGGAQEHNIAKEFLLNTKSGKQQQLVTAPVPLSNDSFGTNRSSPSFKKVEIPSRESLYPSRILIDFALFEDVDDILHLRGVGEAIGLYYSLWDYYSIRKSSPPESLIDDVEKSISGLIYSIKDKKTIWTRLLALNLIEKCLVMRVAGDNQIGAGGDHLIAYALECYCGNGKDDNCRKLSHGKLVYLGSVAMAALFPEWKYSFFSLENLIDFGMEMNILEHRDLNLLVDISTNGLIPLALRMRPYRLTSLSTLSSNRIKNGWIRINKYLRGILN